MIGIPIPPIVDIQTGGSAFGAVVALVSLLVAEAVLVAFAARSSRRARDAAARDIEEHAQLPYAA